MDKENMGSIRLKSNEYLRGFLDINPLRSYKDLINVNFSCAVSEMHCFLDIMIEMMKRLWDEFEGHQDLCRERIIPGRWIDDDADDGWGMSKEQQESFDNLTRTIEKTRGEIMDKQIRKVEKDVKKGAKGKAMKDIKTLKKMDVKFDKKIDKAKKVMKKGC